MPPYTEALEEFSVQSAPKPHESANSLKKPTSGIPVAPNMHVCVCVYWVMHSVKAFSEYHSEKPHKPIPPWHF